MSHPAAPLLVRAARGEPVERTPVWYMRQAGRSLPEYRAIRAHHDLLAICRQPELCAEVTLQPVSAHGVDAAVIYSDIMLPLPGMGLEVEIVEGVGPVVRAPVRSLRDVERLRPLEPEEAVPWLLEAIAIVRRELAPERAVIAFAGGPFTVASYLVEGRASRTFEAVKSVMYGAPQAWHRLMELLAESFARFVSAQTRAGADAIQLFDSWAGALSRQDYREFVAPYSGRVLAAVDVPTVHFATGCAHLLPDLRDAGGQVIGLDWRLPIDEAWALVGAGRGVQGNLDPALLLGPFERVERETVAILERVGGRPGHIFNLGHGVLPATDPAALNRLRELVHERTARSVAA